MAGFPAWFYAPDGAAQVFADADAVPDGWADTPAAFDVAEVSNETEVVTINPAADNAETFVPDPSMAPARRGPGRPRKIAA